MNAVLEQRNHFQEAFETVEKFLPWRDIPVVLQTRRSALENFNRTGFPTVRDDAWRLTDLTPLTQIPFAMAKKPARISSKEARRALLTWLPSRLIFVDGILSSELSSLPSEPGLDIDILSADLPALPKRLESLWGDSPTNRHEEGGNALRALNSAFLNGGALLHPARGLIRNEPIQLAFLSSSSRQPLMTHPRIVIEAEPESRLCVIEESAVLEGSPSPSWSNRVAEIKVGENASIDYCQIQQAGMSKTMATTLTAIRQEANSRLRHFCATIGGTLIRNNIRADLAAEGAQCTLNGLYLAKGKDHIDNHTLIEHSKPRGTSRELYKGVLDQEATAVFSGTIAVEPQAQKSDAMVYNKNLLLSERGWVNTKPEFKIRANDVQCRHGSTIGQLPQDAFFYLRARGIGPHQARQMLVHAFAGEMINETLPQALREALVRHLNALSGAQD